MSADVTPFDSTRLFEFLARKLNFKLEVGRNPDGSPLVRATFPAGTVTGDTLPYVVARWANNDFDKEPEGERFFVTLRGDRHGEYVEVYAPSEMAVRRFMAESQEYKKVWGFIYSEEQIRPQIERGLRLAATVVL